MLAKLKDQRFLALALAALGMMSIMGFLYFIELAFLWSMGLVFCSGSLFILGLSYVSLRTHHSMQAASLSGMAQCVGYSLAATGPILAGSLHTYFSSWGAVLWLCAFLILLCGIFGYLGGRNIYLDKDV